MVLTAPPPPVDALPFHGAHDWQAAARPASTGDVAVAGPSSPPREGSPRPHPAHNIPRFNASPALAQQQASPRALDAPELDWNELLVSAV